MSNQIPKIRLLLLTGTEAYIEIQEMDWSSVQNRFDIEVRQMEISTVAFLTPKQLESELNALQSTNFDYILVSGLIPWDVAKINCPFADKIKKGTKFIAQLPEILLNFDIHSFSNTIAVDKLYQDEKKVNIEKFLQNAHSKCKNNGENECFALSNNHPKIIFSPYLPPIIIAEIIDAPRLTIEEICNKVEYFQKEGADIIDIGCIANEDNSDLIAHIFHQLKTKYTIPFSIDSVNPAEIHAAVNNGAEMVFSVNLENIDQILDLPREIPLVVIPIAFSYNQGPLSPIDRVRILMELGTKLAENGFNKILLDPITNAPIYPGIIPSIEALSLLYEGIQNLPDRDEDGAMIHKPHLLLGACNVTELIDADSSGINAMLAVIATELGITTVLTNEYSNKNRKSVEELKQSLLLTYYAKQQKIAPINCGLSALRLKSKQKYPSYKNFGEPHIDVEPNSKPTEMDPNGYFKIYLNLEKNQILVTHFTNAIDKPDATRTYIGSKAETIYKQIIHDQLVSRLDHAAYLGKELMRAEQALKFGTEYFDE